MALLVGRFQLPGEGRQGRPFPVVFVQLSALGVSRILQAPTGNLFWKPMFLLTGPLIYSALLIVVGCQVLKKTRTRVFSGTSATAELFRSGLTCTTSPSTIVSLGLLSEKEQGCATGTSLLCLYSVTLNAQVREALARAPIARINFLEDRMRALSTLSLVKFIPMNYVQSWLVQCTIQLSGLGRPLYGHI